MRPRYKLGLAVTTDLIMIELEIGRQSMDAMSEKSGCRKGADSSFVTLLLNYRHYCAVMQEVEETQVGLT